MLDMIAVVAVSAVLFISIRPATAFVPSTFQKQQHFRVSTVSTTTTTPRRYGLDDNVVVPFLSKIMVMETRLHLAAVDDNNEENTHTDDPTATTAAASEEEVPVADDDAEEDPEITALKEEIASLETELKMVRRKVADVSDRADDFTQPGYARKVAEMENMRRARSVRLLACLLRVVARSCGM